MTDNDVQVEKLTGENDGESDIICVFVDQFCKA